MVKFLSCRETPKQCDSQLISSKYKKQFRLPWWFLNGPWVWQEVPKNLRPVKLEKLTNLFLEMSYLRNMKSKPFFHAVKIVETWNFIGNFVLRLS